MPKQKQTKAVPSILNVKASKECAERATADLLVPDPEPARAVALIEGTKKQEEE